jgi:hypothetical protein
MTFVVKDRVKETCNSPGSSSVTLLGQVVGYSAFSTIGSGNSTYYTIADQSGINWEVGIGTWTSGGSYGTLSRDTVISNSAGTTAKINFSSGIQDVFCTYPAEQAVYQGTDATIIPGTSGAIYLAAQTITQNTTVPAGYNGMVLVSVNVANGVTLTVENGSAIVAVA